MKILYVSPEQGDPSLSQALRAAGPDVVLSSATHLGDAAHWIFRNLDLSALILDAHFTPAEIPRYTGWGHSDWRTCCQFAAANDVGSLWLFHHKPGRTDAELVRIKADAKRVFAATEVAAEGDALQL